MKKRLDEKLAALHADPHGCKEFILADAKDADMGFGRTAPAPLRQNGTDPVRHGSRENYLDQIRQIIDQDIVDIMLLSASNLEQLAIREKRFAASAITPAARANDTSDIWVVRGGTYIQQPSRPFRSATLDHIKYGKLSDSHDAPVTGADLGLYSMTFSNDIERDHASLEAFADFRIEAERKGFRYFLEVFNPNVETGLSAEETGAFLNDHIIRSLAGVTSAGRPVFLKIPYNGPRAMEELASYDPHMIVGILGGSAGTTRDAFQLLHDAQKYGARVALYGRKINLSEHPLAMIELLRAVANGLDPVEAVKQYHDRLQCEKITPARPLEKDMELTSSTQSYGS